MFLNINDLPRPVQGPFQVPEGGDAPASSRALPCRVISLLGITHPHLAGTAGEVGGPQVQVVFLPDDFGVTVPWEAVAAQFAVADSGFASVRLRSENACSASSSTGWAVCWSS